MNKYIGKKWSQLTIEQQEGLLSNANTTEEEGDCIIDLTKELSVAGKVVVTEDEDYIEIEDDAIIYNPEKGTIVENEKFKGLVSLKDAGAMFDKEESTLRHAIKRGKFKEWEDCIKFGTTWVFDIKALEREYGKK